MAKQDREEGHAARGLPAPLSGGATRSDLIAAEEEHRQFVEEMRRRGQAAERLGKDLLTEVPLLYGSPGSLEARGDPGIAIAEIHREELIRRSGGGVGNMRPEKPDRLPYETATLVIAFVAAFILLLAR